MRRLEVNSRRIRMIFGLVVVAAALVAATAQAQMRGAHRVVRTTVPTPYETVRVTMTDSSFTLSRHTGPQEWDARFVIHNAGTKPHAFDLRGTKKADVAFESALNTLVQPGQTKTTILFLNQEGAAVQYFGSLPADRNNKRMQGIFKIGPCVNFHVKNNAFGGYTLCPGTPGGGT